jgi:hypothetical protein
MCLYVSVGLVFSVCLSLYIFTSDLNWKEDHAFEDKILHLCSKTTATIVLFYYLRLKLNFIEHMHYAGSGKLMVIQKTTY